MRVPKLKGTTHIEDGRVRDAANEDFHERYTEMRVQLDGPVEFEGCSNTPLP